MAKSIIPIPQADTAWLLHFQTVSTKVVELRTKHKPLSPQAFTNRVWVKHLLRLISGGAK